MSQLQICKVDLQARQGELPPSHSHVWVIVWQSRLVQWLENLKSGGQFCHFDGFKTGNLTIFLADVSTHPISQTLGMAGVAGELGQYSVGARYIATVLFNGSNHASPQQFLIAHFTHHDHAAYILKHRCKGGYHQSYWRPSNHHY